MRTFLLICIMCVLAACKQEKSASVENQTANILSISEPNFMATLNGKIYTTNVNCFHLEEAHFTFKSDKFDPKDTNGGGLVISGFQQDKKLAFTIIDKDNVYSTPAIKDWSKMRNTVSGMGLVFLEGTTESYDIKFELKCH